MIDKTKRIREFDILRGFSAVLMILGHSFIIHPINISKVAWCNELQHFIYNFHMEMFFVVAGAVYFCENYCRFITRKAKKLMIPYAFFGILSVVVHAFAGDMVNKSVPIDEGLFNFLFKGGGYWFIFSLFIMFLIYPVIEKVCQKPWQKAVFAVALLILREVINLPTIFLLDTIAYYLPYFIFGHVMFGKAYNKFLLNKHFLNATVAVLSVAVYIVIDVVGRSHNIDRKFFDYIRALAIITFFLIASHYLVMLADKYKPFVTIERFLQNCSRFSLQLYLFNGYILGVFRFIICRVFGVEIPAVIVLCILVPNLIITLVACKWIIPHIPIIRTCCGLKKGDC